MMEAYNRFSTNEEEFDTEYNENGITIQYISSIFFIHVYKTKKIKREI